MSAARRAAALVAAGYVAMGCATDPPLDVAPSVDLTRFQGAWYEIAKLPRPTQADCFGTVAYYSLTASDALHFVNECHVGALTGPLRTVNMDAKVGNPSVPAKLSLDVGGFYGDYWILDVGRAYEYAVVGHPSRSYLWILSRTPSLDDATLQGVLGRAGAAGFDTSKLEFTVHDGAVAPAAPQGGVAPPKGYGCAGGGTRAGDGPAWMGLALAAAVIATRRARTGCGSGRG